MVKTTQVKYVERVRRGGSERFVTLRQSASYLPHVRISDMIYLGFALLLAIF
jgi:hypothetical protein